VYYTCDNKKKKRDTLIPNDDDDFFCFFLEGDFWFGTIFLVMLLFITVVTFFIFCLSRFAFRPGNEYGAETHFPSPLLDVDGCARLAVLHGLEGVEAE
jgi:hypothetical protein